MKLPPALMLGLVSCAVACSPPPLRGMGGPCVSLSDCSPGLVCDDGRCTGDLSRLAAENDEPPFLGLIDAGRDAGTPTEAGPMDAGTSGPRDSGGPTVDSGPRRDAGPGRDSGPARDAGGQKDAAPPPPKDGG